MFNMLDLLIALSSSETLYTRYFLGLLEPSSLHMLPRQNSIGMLTFPLSAVNLKIPFPLSSK